MKALSEIINDVTKAKTKAEKVEILKNHDSVALRKLLKFWYDPSIKFKLPDDKLPQEFWKESDFLDTEYLLYQELKKRFENIFLESSKMYPDMKQVKREKLYIELLESLHPGDAHLVQDVVSKTKRKGLTVATINAAFDGLI